MKKTFALLLSLIILFSSFNFKLSAHYCGQTLVDIALFGEAKVCPMEAKMNYDSEKSCCADRDIIVEGEEYLSSKRFDKKEVSKVELILAILQFPIKLLIEEQQPNYLSEQHSPPLIERDITLEVQSFLL